MPAPVLSSHGVRGLRHRCEQLVDAVKPAAQIIWPFAVPEPQIPVHPEMIAGDDEHAFFIAKTSNELRRVDWIVVADVDDGARLRPNPRETGCVVPQPRFDER